MFAEYHVPEGAWLFVYNDAGDQLGAFTANSNGGRPSMGVSQLPGDGSPSNTMNRQNSQAKVDCTSIK